MSDSMEWWGKMARPPASALRQIGAGRLKGKSDIQPQWRYQVMTETFGPCGIGWKFEIKRLWAEPGPADQVFAFAEVNVYVGEAGAWSAPIPGIGGHYLVQKETAGLHANDEGYKMAVTDALGTAMKMLGVAADIYSGRWDGTKYLDPPDSGTPISDDQIGVLRDLLSAAGRTEPALCKWLKLATLEELPATRFKEIQGVLSAAAKTPK